jgi:hypothetical protein
MQANQKCLRGNMLAFVIGAKLKPKVSRPDVSGALAARRPGGASFPAASGRSGDDEARKRQIGGGVEPL